MQGGGLEVGGGQGDCEGNLELLDGHNHIAQVNDGLVLAAGTNLICVYDQSLHKSINYQAAIDESSAELARNLVLGGNGARVRILNGPFALMTWEERLGIANDDESEVHAYLAKK